MIDTYTELLRRSREIGLLDSCASVLGWDEQTYMPRGGVENRGEQLAMLAGLSHKKATDSRLGELLEVLAGMPEGGEGDDDPQAIRAANVRELGRDYRRRVRLPRALVEELARETSVGQHEWAEARKANDFARFRPRLASMIALKRRQGECLADGTAADAPYDALLDEYEAGATCATLAPLFGALRGEIVPLVGDILGSGRRPDETALDRDYPVDRQRVFGEAVAAAAGFDFEAGRLDTAAHPFCTGLGPGDTRITTRFDPRDFTESLFGILHEAGHAMYDQGLDPIHCGTPMGEAASLGVHESQSRLWENAVGRGRPFWEHWFPLARRVFRDGLSGVDLDGFLFAVNRVRPSLIRTQADEVTYNLHVAVRFELERALISGDLAAGDLPGAWSERYKGSLGVASETDADGCLQDVHWSAGLFGYFPTYTLGNIYAAQLYAKADADLGGLDGPLSRGDCSGLLAWLRDKVHRHGRRFAPARLIERAAGAPPDHRPLVAALRRKYGTLYGVA